MDLEFMKQLGPAIYAAPNLANRDEPRLYRTFYPRRYAEPKGWFSPRVFAWTCAVAYEEVCLGLVRELTKNLNADLMVVTQLASNRVPTWFVGEELFEALLDTEPPRNFFFKDIHWPVPALLFMLPIEASRRVFGRNIFALSGCKVPLPYSTPVPTVPGAMTLFKGALGVPRGPFIGYKKEHENYESMCIIRADSYLLDGQPDGVFNRRFPHGATDTIGDYLKCREFPMNYDFEDNRRAGDDEVVDQLTSLFLQLLLLMSMEQEVVDTSVSVQVPGRSIGKGPDKKLITPALFRAKWVGENYRRPKAPPQGGHHASPVVHLRCGHWRQQRIGPGRSQIKAVWIEPTWVNAAA